MEYKLLATLSPAGQRICSVVVPDYALEGSILERISCALLLPKRRFVAYIEEERVMDAGSPVERPRKTVAHLTRFKQEAHVSVTIVPLRCCDCDTEMSPALHAKRFATRYIAEHWEAQCACPDGSYRYSVSDYGWKPLRLWQHLVQRARGSQKSAHAGTEPKPE